MDLGYAKFLESDWGRGVVADLFLTQAKDQIQAARTRPVRWYFSQRGVADYAEELFKGMGALQKIEVKFESWPEREK